MYPMAPGHKISQDDGNGDDDRSFKMNLEWKLERLPQLHLLICFIGILLFFLLYCLCILASTANITQIFTSFIERWVQCPCSFSFFLWYAYKSHNSYFLEEGRPISKTAPSEISHYLEGIPKEQWSASVSVHLLWNRSLALASLSSNWSPSLYLLVNSLSYSNLSIVFCTLDQLFSTWSIGGPCHISRGHHSAAAATHCIFLYIFWKIVGNYICIELTTNVFVWMF